MAESQPRPDEKLCPFCAETIKAAAVRCRYCQSDLPQPEAEPEPQPEAETEPEPPPPPPATQSASPPLSEPVGAAPAPVSFWAGSRLLVILLVLCLLLAGVVGVAWWLGERSDEGQASDGPITSAQARDAGLQEATSLTEQVLSYDWQTLDQDIEESEAVLAPSFRTEYAKTMDGVRAETAKNQVKLVADAVATSIVSASEKKVVALVFVNQVTTAKGSGQRLDQNRVLVTLTRDGGEWRVSKMDAF